MSLTHFSRGELKNVSRQDVIAYLKAKGWDEAASFDDGLVVFRWPHSPNDELQLPPKDFRDYEDRIEDILLLTARSERRKPEQVFEDLQYARADVLHRTISGPSTVNGTIPFPDAIEFYESWKNAVLAVARSVTDPQPYYGRLVAGKAEQFFEACRIGQTHRGSYVGTLICPLYAVEGDTIEEQGQLFAAPPVPTFTRQVTTSFIDTVNTLANAIKSESLDLLSKSEAPQGLSANLAEALSEMLEAPESTVDFEVSWAPSLPIDGERPKRATLTSRMAPRLREVARSLRPATKARVSEFVGIIDQLRGEPDSNLLMRGDAILKFMHEDSVIRARIELDPDQYQKAVQAHGSAKHVALQGELQFGRTMHAINGVRDLRIIETSGN